MKLTLDHTMRLNLHALMGAQRGSVDEIRVWWRLQDQIDLTEEEKKEINYRVGTVGEMQAPMWDVNKSIKARSFEFSDEDYGKIAKVVKEWQPGFLASNDRRWLEPLLAQLDATSKVNGNAATEAPIPTRHRARVD